MTKFQMYIDGRYVDAADGQWFDSYNPYTGKVWAQVAQGSREDAQSAVSAAHRALTSGAWPAMTATQRGLLLHKLGDLVKRDAGQLAELEVQDNGKLIAHMRAQLNYLPQTYYYYAGLADKIEGSVLPLDKKGYMNYTRHEPVGVVVAITAWNSPLLLAAWKLAPALAAGCTVVIKPSEFASASTAEFMKLVEEAGFPPGVVNVVTGYGRDVGDALVTDPRVAKIAFTGSDSTGRVINEAAAKSFKRVTLELGGKSPNIVFADANIDDAVNGVIGGIYSATGQTCVAGSRLLIQESIHDAFVERILSLARTARMGDPMSVDTHVGPITSKPQYEKILGCIQTAKQEGATAVLGGGAAKRPECGSGWFVEPTIFTNVKNNMRIAQEEVFGPVLSVIKFKDEDEALSIANDVRFGLGAGVWTGDVPRAIRMSQRIKAGTVWINNYRTMSYMSPFGGYKDSGIGKENGQEAIRAYLQTKSVWINVGAPVGNPFVIK